MEKVLNLYKREGETPLETINRFRKENQEYQKEKMTYAGRLDPIAEGVLLVLVGEECKNKNEYLEKDKEYEFEVLWSFQTDTYDILGFPKKTTEYTAKHFNNDEILSEIKKIKGKFIQKYPPFSSKTVKGKQLFQWARDKKLDEIDFPEREVQIYDIQFLGNREIDGKSLLDNIRNRIEKVSGDFRQREILKEWNSVLEDSLEKQFIISRFKVKCSSGTYVRGIANILGEKIKTKAIAFAIKRTKIF